MFYGCHKCDTAGEHGVAAAGNSSCGNGLWTPSASSKATEEVRWGGAKRGQKVEVIREAWKEGRFGGSRIC